MQRASSAAALKARVFNACTPSAALEAFTKANTQPMPKPRNALVNLLLRANYRSTDTNARINLLRKLALQDRNTAVAYQCIADDLNAPVKAYDAKTLHEVINIEDGNGKTVMMHSIDHENCACIHALDQVAINQLQAIKTLRYTTKNNKLQALLCLLRSTSAVNALTESQNLTKTFEVLPDATIEELNTYYAAMDLAQKNNQQRVHLYKETVSSKTISSRLPIELLGSIQEMLQASNPYDPTKMMPALEEAIIKGNVPALTHALNQGCNVQLPNADNMNALELAAYHGQSDVLQYLAENSPYVTDQQLKKLVEITLERLMHAQSIIDRQAKGQMITNLEATMKYLEEIPDYIQKKNTELITNAGHTGATLKALNHGANPNAKLDNGQPIIRLAAMGNNPSLMKLLLKNGADANVQLTFPDNSQAQPLYIAVHNNQDENFKLLLEHNADTETKNSFGANPLHTSLLQDPKYMRSLLAKGANPNSKVRSEQGNDISLLEWALMKDKLQHAEILLEHGAGANAISHEGYPLAFDALCKDSPQFLKLLLKHGANPNAKVRSDKGNVLSLLKWALNKNKPEHAKILLEHGADANYITYTGKPLVWDALFEENTAFLKLLLKHGVDPNTKVRSNDGDDISLLEWAIMKNKLEHAKILLEYGADANYITYTGGPLAWYTLFKENTEFLKLLLIYGANPNTGDWRSKSLLDGAVLNKKTKHVEILLKHGAKHTWIGLLFCKPHYFIGGVIGLISFIEGCRIAGPAIAKLVSFLRFRTSVAKN